jgi:phosphoserine phosphatase
LSSTTFPLGMLPFRRPPVSQTLDLAPGDVLALVSDGFFECENAAGEQFGKERVGEIVASSPVASEIVDRLVAEADAFRATAPQGDDMTALVVRRVG